MNKQEFNDRDKAINSQIELLKKQLAQMREDYLKEHREFQNGDCVLLTYADS